MAGVINLALSVITVGSGLSLDGSVLSVTGGQSTVDSVIAPAGDTLTLAGNDSSGGSIVLGLGSSITMTGALQGISVRVNNQSGNYELTATDYYVGYTGAGGHTFTLPAAASHSGRLYVIKNRGGSLTLAVTGGGQLWTTAAASTMTLITGESALVISDGTYWMVAAMASGIITV